MRPAFYALRLTPFAATPSNPNTVSIMSNSTTLPEFPFPLVAVPGSRAIDEWRRLQMEWRSEGASPVVLGNREAVAMLKETSDFNESSAEEIMDAAAGLSAEQIFKKLREAEEDGFLDEEEGEWPTGQVEPQNLLAHLNILTGEPQPVVYIAMIPTPRSYEIPAYLKYGAWNACPSPEEHVAILRYWYERYGIELYSSTSDVIECVVARPPQNRESAMALAREQFLYCTDIVTQGVGSIANLASILLNGKCWYFWWD